MFPYALQGVPPTDLETFEHQLETGLSRYFRYVPAEQLVQIGPDSQLNNLTNLTIDLTNAHMDAAEVSTDEDFSFFGVNPLGGAPDLRIGHLSVVGAPVLINNVPLQTRLEADEVALVYAYTEKHRPVLKWAGGRGTYSLSITRQGLETLAREIIDRNAREHNLRAQEFHLDRLETGPDRLHVELRLKVGLSLRVMADVALRKNLTAKVTNVTLEADGIGSAILLFFARGFIQPYLDKIKQDQQGFPTGLFPLEIPLAQANPANRLEISAVDPLELRATFQS